MGVGLGLAAGRVLRGVGCGAGSCAADRAGGCPADTEVVVRRVIGCGVEAGSGNTRLVTNNSPATTRITAATSSVSVNITLRRLPAETRAACSSILAFRLTIWAGVSVVAGQRA